MIKEEVFHIVKSHIVTFLPDVEEDAIPIEAQLEDLGANSIDRMEIVIKSMETVGVKVPLVELGRVSNIEGLVNLLHAKTLV